MKVRVLGCSGAIAKDCRTTSFLVGADVLVDAGTGVGDLTLDEMLAVDHVLLTHAHLDHVAALPLMLDAVASQRTTPVQVYALAATIAALKTHIFNDLIWPDFTRLPSPQAPFISFREIAIGEVLQIGNKHIEVLPAVHTVAAAGFAVSGGGPCWVFSGDTGRNSDFWRRISQLQVGMLVIETAFSTRERALAEKSLHLSPEMLAEELDTLADDRRFPIYITHTKPAETGLIMAEIRVLEERRHARIESRHDIRWLQAGQEFEI